MIAEAEAIRIWVLKAGAEGGFDPAPIATLRADAAPLGPFAIGRYLETLAGSMEAAGDPAVPIRPGDLLRIVGFATDTGYAGRTYIRVPSLADL